MVQLQNPSKRTTLSPRTRVYNGFTGVDFSSDSAKVSLKRSPNSINMYKNYSVELGQCVETRPGFRRMIEFPNQEDNAVYGYNFFELKTEQGRSTKPIFHVGEKLFLWANYPENAVEEGDIVELYSGMNRGFSFMLVFEENLYVIDGKNYLVYDGETVKDVKEAAFIPTTYTGRPPLGGGQQYQQVNRLQPTFKNSFLAEEGKRDYYLSVKEIDDTPVKATVNGEEKTEGTDFTVNREEGKVTFNTAPPVPDTAGQDNVVITASKTVEKYAPSILHCTVATVFDNRIFLAGNPDTPNTIYFSQLNDPTYFGELTYEQVGTENTNVMGFMRINDALATLKDSSQQEPTVFLHETNDTGVDYNVKTYPAKDGLAGSGCISKRGYCNFLDDPVFISSLGLQAIGKMNVGLERSIEHRSSLVDGKLVNEEGLNTSVLKEWRGYLLCLVNGRIYLADSRQRYKQYATDVVEYEWFFWENIGVYEGEVFKPATSLMVYQDALYFGTESGVLCKFNTDQKTGSSGELFSAAYNDDGKPIFWCWTTPFDNFGDSNHIKKDNKRGNVLELKSMTRSYIKGKCRTNKDFWKDFTRVDGGYFDFNDLDFSDMNFNTLDQNNVAFVTKKKRFIKKQIMFYGDELNRPGGIYSITMEIFTGGYFK